MKYSIWVPTILTAITVCGCTSTKSPNLSIDKNQAKIKLQIPEIKENEPWHYSDVFSKVEFITLEATPTSMVGNIQNMEITPNKDYIVFDRENRKVARFDSTGHFLNTIGECGHGASEYINPSSISYDKYNDQLAVFDSNNKAIMFYSLDGEYANQIKLDRYFSDFCILDKDHIVIFFDYFSQNTGYNYWIIDREGKPLSKFEQIAEENLLKAFPSTQGTFTNENSNLLCRSHFSDIVYRVVGTDVEPYIHITDPSGNFDIGDPKDVANFTQRDNSISFLAQIKKTIFINISKGCYVYTWAVTPEKSFIGLSPDNDLSEISLIGQLLNSDGQNVYYAVSPESAEISYDCLVKNATYKNATIDEKVAEQFMRFSANKNPIIQICTVKE